MKLETARKLVPVLAALAILSTVASMITRENNYTVGLYCAILGLVFLAAMLVVVFVGLKCPYCGKRLIHGGMRIIRCPHCGRDLESGLKTKKK